MGNGILNTNYKPAAHNRTKSGIWLALLIALGLHALILMLPLSTQQAVPQPALAQIELQLIKPESPPVTRDVFLTAPETPAPPASLPEPDAMEKSLPPASSPATEVALTPPAAILVPSERDPERMNTLEKNRLTRTILNSQFMTEKSVADQLFGEPLAHYSIKAKKEFHYPQRDNLAAILNQPMQKLPFEYTPGLIYFAYSPGVQGDLQRLWDSITPEFGWITRHGTEVKCKLILIIAGCAWK